MSAADTLVQPVSLLSQPAHRRKHFEDFRAWLHKPEIVTMVVRTAH